jgi:hypothetical protein
MPNINHQFRVNHHHYLLIKRYKKLLRKVKVLLSRSANRTIHSKREERQKRLVKQIVNYRQRLEPTESAE